MFSLSAIGFLALAAIALADEIVVSDDGCYEKLDNVDTGSNCPYICKNTDDQKECLTLCRKDPKCVGAQFNPYANRGRNPGAKNCRMYNVIPGNEAPYTARGNDRYSGGTYGHFWSEAAGKNLTDEETEEYVQRGIEIPLVRGAPLDEEDIQRMAEIAMAENKDGLKMASELGHYDYSHYRPYIYKNPGYSIYRWRGVCSRKTGKKLRDDSDSKGSEESKSEKSSDASE